MMKRFVYAVIFSQKIGPVPQNLPAQKNSPPAPYPGASAKVMEAPARPMGDGLRWIYAEDGLCHGRGTWAALSVIPRAQGSPGKGRGWSARPPGSRPPIGTGGREPPPASNLKSGLNIFTGYAALKGRGTLASLVFLGNGWVGSLHAPLPPGKKCLTTF
jgi:hypothetical protein